MSPTNMMKNTTDESGKTVVDFFEEQVCGNPGGTALVCNSQVLTFGELNERANQLARLLITKGVKSETIVPICIGPGINMVTCILAVLKAGGAYVPVDPEYPLERINFIIEDTNAQVVVGDNTTKAIFDGLSAIEFIEADDKDILTGYQKLNIQSLILHHQLAYVIYTSGSTGKPKGVMIEHGSLLSYLFNQQTDYINNASNIAGSYFHLSFTFDASVTALFMPLLSGKATVITSKKSFEVFDDPNFHKYAPYDFIKLTPAHLHVLEPKFLVGDKIPVTKKLIVGGEALNYSHFEYLVDSGLEVEIINEYGPTEATVGCSVYTVNTRLFNKDEDNRAISIGKPIDGVEMYILNNKNGLVPAGIPGEICISGPGLARGYLNRVDLTNEKFVTISLASKKDLRIYKTGDTARRLPGGNIEFLGRKDDQVKIRGYRVELGEIESLLLQNEHVKQAVVLAREDKSGFNQLLGYIVLAVDDYDAQSLSEYLQSKVPGYMVPAAFLLLDELPLTINGKVDKKALESMEIQSADITKESVPATSTEIVLAEIWKNLLELDEVGIHEDFFNVGGHSLLAIRVVSAVRKQLKVELSINDIFDFTTIASLAGHIDSMGQDDKPEIAVVQNKRPEFIPLSFSQERLWFIDRLEGSIQYHVPAVLGLKGELNRQALEFSLRAIISRHEVLRTVIREKDGQPYQLINSAENWTLSVMDKVGETENNLDMLIQQLIKKPFNLSADYMLRADLLVIAPNEYTLVVTVHHIASDGWSRSILVKEVAALYNAFDQNREVGLQPLSFQYADFSIWQRQYLQTNVLEQKMAYWKVKLFETEPLQLPSDFTRPPVWNTEGTTIAAQFDKELLAKLQQLSQRSGVTLFMTLLAAFKVLIYRYSNQNDICVGTPIAGRLRHEFEDLMGFFVNTLAIRDQLYSDQSFTELLSQVKKTTLEAFDHQEVPFEKIVDEVVVERSINKNPLFQVMFVMLNMPEIPVLKIGDLVLSGKKYAHTTTLFDLQFFINETPDGLKILVEYSTHLFKAETVARMIDHFNQLLESIVADPLNNIGSLPMLTTNEEQLVVSGFNETTVDFDLDKNVISLINEQVKKAPASIAVKFEGTSLTYCQLDETSNQLANYLVKLGVKADMPVPIFLDRSLNMIVGILGIMKAGGAYVPIDPEYPVDRVRYMISNVGAKIIVVDKSSHSKLVFEDHINVVDLDSNWSEIGKYSSLPPGHLILPDHLAYIIFTSGSTGQPKGAMNEHRALINRLLWAQKEFELKETDIVLQKTTFSFDVSVWELLLPLISGSRLVFAKPGGQKENDYLQNIILSEGITIMHFVPSMLAAFLPDIQDNQFVHLKKVLCSGEALKPGHVQLFKQKLPGVALYNLYGPTEAAIDVTCWTVPVWDDTEISMVSIGKPVANTSIYILDKEGKPVPVGIAGEIHIGGVQVGRGYLNQTELTFQKFIRNPFSRNGETRLYKTGDVGRWLADGNIEYIGRIDDQVKIRGFRIELGEIESVLDESGLVSQAVVLAKEDSVSNKRLVSYYVPDGEILKAKERELYENRIASWEELYETEYGTTEDNEAVNQEFNLVGWNNSFTGEAIKEQEMQEWLDDIVEVILSEKPKNVLEIGSGTGLIYYQLAGKVNKYIATDFSNSSINQIRQRISKGLRDYGETQLQVCAAHEISVNEEDEIDTVVINSVVQYFPGEEYMNTVIGKSISLLDGMGRIIIGDVRDNRLLELFKSRLQANKLKDSVSIKEFKWIVEHEVLKENELCFSPEYFNNLKFLYPEITNIEILWKRSSYTNELTAYRYTVIISVGIKKELIECNWQNWSELSNKQNIVSQLEQNVEVIAIKHAPNPRLTKERLLKNSLNNDLIKTVGDLLNVINKEDSESVEMQSILDTAKNMGYQCRLLLAEDPLQVNVLLELKLSGRFIGAVSSDKDFRSTFTFTNVPLFFEINSLIQKDIRSKLHQRLPEYSVPSEFIALRKMPVTNNGKVDRKFLSQRDERSIVSNLNYLAPETEIEQFLATIWQELLGLERVGIHDNFFELGGDSITTIQVVSRLRRVGYHLQPRDLFINQTIAKLSEIINIGKEVVTHGEQGILHGDSGLVPIQQWFLNADPVDVSYFNQAVLLSINKTITTEMLEEVYGHLLQQHDALRFIYDRKGGAWHQQYGNKYGNIITEVLVEQGSALSLADQIKDKASHYQSSLDIFNGEIVRFVHFITPGTQDQNRLFMVIHHLAVDGVSWRIILEDLVLILTAIRNGQAVLQGAKSSSYRQWYQALEQYGKQPAVLAQLTYWQKAVKAFTPLKAEPDFPVSALAQNTSYHSARLSEKFTHHLVQDVPKVYHTEINDLLLAALTIVFTRYMNTKQVVIGLEGHGREHIDDTIDTSRTVGWFTSLYPVALQLPRDKGYDNIIKSVKEQLRRVPQKGLGYGVLKYINKHQELQGNEPWEIMFNYLGQLDNVIAKSKWFGSATEPTGSSRSALQSIQEKLVVNSSIQGGQLIVNWACNGSYFTPENIELLSQQYLQTIEQLVDHCLNQFKISGPVFTPSDFGLGAEISYSELDRFLAEPYKHGTRKEHTESIYRLNGLQQGLLFHGLYEEGAIAYIDQFSCDLAKVNIPLLSATWKMILDRHTILRSSFHYDAFSIPVQCVYHSVDLPLDIMDLRNLTGEEQRIQVDQFARQDRIKGFDFKISPLMRISLLQLADDRYRMVWTYSHILFDGWSMPVLMEEFLTTYQQLSQNHELPLIKVDKFEDYIRFIEQQDEAKEQAYWKDLVKQVTENTLLPFVNKRSGKSDVAEVYEKITLTFNEKITASIQQYAHQNLLTINTVMQGVWAYLLHHYTNSQAITYGVIVSGRPEELPDIEKRVGMFINTLPLISTIHKGEKISGWLQQLQHTQVASRQYQYTPLTQVQQWAGIMGDWFDTLLVFENYPINKLIKSERWNLDIENVQVDYQTNYPFNIIIASAEQINVGFSFNTQLISSSDAHKIRDHFEHVLLQIVSGKENTEDIHVITPGEEYRLLYEYNNTHVEYPHEKTLIHLFEENVKIHANLPALVFEGLEVSYAEMNSRANQLAHYLHQSGLQPETLVPVCIQRGVNMMVAIMGILKCGAAYVPIDVEYPEERITYILQDTGSTLLITDSATLPKIPVYNQIEVLNLDKLSTEINKRSIENSPVHVTPHQLAYVIYTSGSTGTPKGVMIEHAGVVNLALSQAKSLKLRPGLRSLQFASFGFDASCYEIFNTLLSGGTLVIPQKEDLLSAPAFGRMLELNQVELAVLPPSFQQEIKENTGNLKTIVSAGEPLNATTARYFQSKDIRLINAYGPTENTVCTTMTDDPLNNEGRITIGRPVANVQVFIVDRLGNLCAEKINGELCIEGEQLARGYLNREDLTGEKFLERSFIGNSRLYKSGDICRWLPGGNIVYVGRIDDQVKIRGFRIEPGEIEHTLVNSPLVKEAVVLAIGDRQHNKKLVAYVVTCNGFTKETITAYLSQILPAYMVPAVFVNVEKMPVTSSGKIDKKALSILGLEESEVKNYVPPVTELEIKLTRIWEELLGIDKIGIEDNFFELGGNSLLAMRMTAHIERTLGLTIPIQVLFQARCITDLSKYFEIQTNNIDIEKNTEIFELLDV